MKRFDVNHFVFRYKRYVILLEILRHSKQKTKNN